MDNPAKSGEDIFRMIADRAFDDVVSQHKVAIVFAELSKLTDHELANILLQHERIVRSSRPSEYVPFTRALNQIAALRLLGGVK